MVLFLRSELFFRTLSTKRAKKSSTVFTAWLQISNGKQTIGLIFWTKICFAIEINVVSIFFFNCKSLSWSVSCSGANSTWNKFVFFFKLMDWLMNVGEFGFTIFLLCGRHVWISWPKMTWICPKNYLFWHSVRFELCKKCRKLTFEALFLLKVSEVD